MSDDTLLDTFNLFFGETEETAGTGTVVRAVNGELTSVVVDQDERDAFLREKREEADTHNAEVSARIRAEADYYAEEPVG